MARRDTSDSSLDAIAQRLDELSLEELREVKAMLEILLEAKAWSGDRYEGEASEPEFYQGPRGGVGHIEVKLIRDSKRGKTYGPYRYLRYWKEGKLKTRYIGKVDF